MNGVDSVPPMTNRERLLNARHEIERVRQDMTIGPTAVAYLNVAVAALEDVSNYVLGDEERPS